MILARLVVPERKPSGPPVTTSSPFLFWSTPGARSPMPRIVIILLAMSLSLVESQGRAEAPQAERAMKRAAEFFRKDVASEGGYVWRYSSDLKHRQGEGV